MGRELSPGYLEKIFGQARTVIGWAIKDRIWQGVNPIGRDSRFKMPTWRKEKRPTRWFTSEEATKLLAVIRSCSQQLHDMSFLSLRTGMRSMEIFGLGELEDAIDHENGQLNFIGKSGNREWCYADDEVIAMLASYRRRPGEFIFQDKFGNRIKKISKTFQRAIQDADLQSETHKVWFHSWRHAFGSWLAQSGEFTLQEIMKYMRHQDERMTAHYAKLIPGKKRDRVASIIKKKISL